MKRILSTALALAAVAVVAAPSADAATIGGWAGSPNGGSSTASCFQDAWNTVTYVCSDYGQWEIPLYVNEAGVYNVNVTVNCTQPVYCAAYGLTNDGTSASTSSVSVPAYTSDPVSLSNGISYVPDGGYLFAACWLPQNCSWKSVNWNVN